MWFNFYSLIMEKLIITKLPEVKKQIFHHWRGAELFIRNHQEYATVLEAFGVSGFFHCIYAVN